MITKRELLALLADVKDDEEVCFKYCDDQGELIASGVTFSREQVDRSYCMLAITFKDGRKVECDYRATDGYAIKIFNWLKGYEIAGRLHGGLVESQKMKFKQFTGYDYDDVQKIEHVVKECIEEDKAVIELD